MTGNEIFTLLVASNQKCSRIECNELATHVLIGKENEFLGFYCLNHGNNIRNNLEIKYQFEKENRILPKRKIIRKRNYYRRKK